MNLRSKIALTALCLVLAGCGKKDYSHLLYAKEEEDSPTTKYQGKGANDVLIGGAIGPSFSSNGTVTANTGLFFVPNTKPYYYGNFEEQALKAKDVISELEEIAGDGKRFKAELGAKLKDTNSARYVDFAREYDKFRVYADSVRMWKREFNSMVKSEDGFSIEGFISRRQADKRDMITHLNNAKNIAAGVQ